MIRTLLTTALITTLLVTACSETQPPESDDMSTTAGTIAEVETTPEASAEREPSGLGDGTYRIGDDVAPGTYRAAEASDACYWERLSGFSGSLDDLIANGLGSGGPEIVTIDEGDAGFTSRDCGEWFPLAESDLSSLTGFSDGTYVVGGEVAPGTWTAPGGEGCYWERLDGFTGSLDDVLANDIPTGSVVVTIEPADAGFRARGCGEWTQ